MFFKGTALPRFAKSKIPRKIKGQIQSTTDSFVEDLTVIIGTLTGIILSFLFKKCSCLGRYIYFKCQICVFMIQDYFIWKSSCDISFVLNICIIRQTQQHFLLVLQLSLYWLTFIFPNTEFILIVKVSQSKQRSFNQMISIIWRINIQRISFYLTPWETHPCSVNGKKCYNKCCLFELVIGKEVWCLPSQLFRLQVQSSDFPLQ
jgi:hypothetical protein